jgi:hypothetical protein
MLLGLCRVALEVDPCCDHSAAGNLDSDSGILLSVIEDTASWSMPTGLERKHSARRRRKCREISCPFIHGPKQTMYTVNYGASVASAAPQQGPRVSG